jgi:hypothetical protein
MIRYKTVRGAVNEAVWLAGNISVGKATDRSVNGAVGWTVGGATDWAVFRAVWEAANRAASRHHPHLEEFLRELQTGGSR